MGQGLPGNLKQTAFAFRGYNVTNLGRSQALLEHARYGPIVRDYLNQADDIYRDVIGTRPHLEDRVRQGRETTLRSYAEAIALIVAMELAQLKLLEEFHAVRFAESRMAFGYSLGELSALAACGVIDMRSALSIPLAMAADCAELAKDVTMGILFSRGEALDFEQIYRTCLKVNHESKGVIGVSSILSPNTVLLLGQGKTVKRFKEEVKGTFPKHVHLRQNPHRWPPLHTPLVWERAIPNRSAVMMHGMTGGFDPPKPPIVSLVTGKQSYNGPNTRSIIHQWVDHPQRLWDAICETLSAGVQTVVHVGPEPNLIPATYQRLSENVQQQILSYGRLGARAVKGIARRRWLTNLLPKRTALVRVIDIEQIILEDWLLENEP